MKFRVKVCGITRPEDADLAVQLDVDMIGMIFYKKSPRFVTQKAALDIVDWIPPTVARVGVFVDASIDRILKIGQDLRLDFIQLHGSEPASLTTQLQRERYKVIKAFTVEREQDYVMLLRSRADLCLLDHRTEDLQGGTGRPFDWSVQPTRAIANLVLAGGITADNVRRGVDLFDPLVVDVNSGVEIQPGVKSPRKLQEFMAQCDRIRYGT